VLVAVTGFGSIWERRLARNVAGAICFSRAAYYNTTGISVNGRTRHRWTIGGKIRFNSVGGFDADCPARSVNRVYECGDLSTGPNGWRELLFRRMLDRPARPDCYLITLTSDRTGNIDSRSDCWKAGSAEAIAVSEHRGQQEAMLLMPPWSWVRTELGGWFVEPAPDKYWTGCLRLGSVA
jgi:hypothetical protein